MGAWVATVLRDLFHDTDSLSPPRTPRTADATLTGNAIAGGSHGR
jgi:hypothetical protein